MLAGSLQGKVMGMEDKSRDMEAESVLLKLEERLGMRPATTAKVETQTVSVGGATPPPPPGGGATMSEAEKELAELEKRLAGGN